VSPAPPAPRPRGAGGRGPRGGALPKVSPRIRSFMVAWFERYLHRHLDALRLPHWSAPPARGHRGPIVVYCNHPAWWDAALIIVLAGRLYPERESRAPFDAAMLARYRIFERIGAFGVDLETPRGAAQFLTAARTILSSSDGMLWITAQGRFADARARPLALRPGVARLAEIAPDALFVPLALEYAFWDERGAEAFAAFGDGIAGADLAALPRPERLARLETALTATLDRLSADVISREPERFRSLVSGRKGVGGIYDLWRRILARLTGRRFDPAHRALNGNDRAA
jgi:1-acyl-sn-glycerol-3-phosphate acyltransferase